MLEFDINKVIKELKKQKEKIFVSEKDFQVELAYKIKEIYGAKVDVKLEYCPKFEELNKKSNKKEKPIYIDILVIHNGKWYPIELKYKTRKLENKKEDKKSSGIILNGELIDLKEQGAQDQGRCKFLWDISRIEEIKKQKPNKFEKGYAIFLTNDLSYKLKGNEDNVDFDFRLNDYKKIPKNTKLKWKDGTKPGTISSCPEVIKLDNDYEIKWENYVNIDENYTNNQFEILIVEIT